MCVISSILYNVSTFSQKLCTKEVIEKTLFKHTHTHTHTHKTPLGAQWVRIHLPVQRTQIGYLVWEDSTYLTSSTTLGIPELFYIKVGKMDRAQEKKKKVF